jgi:hypothetical protein
MRAWSRYAASEDGGGKQLEEIESMRLLSQLNRYRIVMTAILIVLAFAQACN